MAQKIMSKATKRTQSAFRKQDMLLLFGIAVSFHTATALLTHQPGYIDGAYYLDVARNLATGHGLTEDFIFTYFTPTQTVVHAGNLYWMPLSSLVIAPFLMLFGTGWHSAQIPEVLLSSALVALAYWLGWDIFHSRRYALGTALLTLFGGFYYPYYFVLTDSFGLYSLECTVTFILLYKGLQGKYHLFALAGIPIALAHLTRVDGVLLLAVAVAVFVISRSRFGVRCTVYGVQSPPIPTRSLLTLIGLYLLVMSPWFVRNMLLIGSPLPTGGTQAIWLTDYNDLFSFHKAINLQSYLAWGWGNILWSKLQAFGFNLFTLSGVTEFVLFPFMLIGLWVSRKRAELLPFTLYFVLLFLAMTLVFSLPTLRGSYLHSLVGLLPALYIWAIMGLDTVIDLISKRFGGPERAARRKRAYLGISIVLSCVLTGYIILYNAATWDQEYIFYQQAGSIIAHDDMHSDMPDVVIVSDPADYYLATSQYAIVLPDQNDDAVLAAADTYGAHYVIAEPLHSKAEQQLWSGTTLDSRFDLIWSGPSGKIYRIGPPPPGRPGI